MDDDMTPRQQKQGPPYVSILDFGGRGLRNWSTISISNSYTFTRHFRKCAFYTL